MYKQLISEQRYTIEVLLKQNWKKKDIAAAIGVSVSTVYRETNRNKGKHGAYTHRLAQELADTRKERLPGNRKIPKRVTDEAVRLLCEEQWSPKQISGWMALKGVHISHETIYGIIRKDKAEGGGLYKNCRHQLKHRKRPVGAVGRIPNRVSIHERPAEADGKRFGDWEMDLITGKDGNGAILSLTERSTNFLFIELLPHGKNAKEVAKAAARLLLPYRKHVRTITTDNGLEFACHADLSKAYPSSLPILTRPGRKEPSNTPTNSSVNTSRKALTSRILRTMPSSRYNHCCPLKNQNSSLKLL